MNALHEQFIAESRQLIEQATEDLIALEREGTAPPRIDRVTYGDWSNSKRISRSGGTAARIRGSAALMALTTSSVEASARFVSGM